VPSVTGHARLLHESALGQPTSLLVQNEMDETEFDWPASLKERRPPMQEGRVMVLHSALSASWSYMISSAEPRKSQVWLLANCLSTGCLRWRPGLSCTVSPLLYFASISPCRDPGHLNIPVTG
jgi:hypothetical protein